MKEGTDIMKDPDKYKGYKSADEMFTELGL